MQDLCSAYRSIFGLDAELNPAVPDYQMLSVFAKALDDASAFMIAGYNSRNPEYASGQALDLLLPTYGLSRLPGEMDAEARARIKKALASLGCCTVDAMEAEIRKVPNVTQILIRVNDENNTVDGMRHFQNFQNFQIPADILRNPCVYTVVRRETPGQKIRKNESRYGGGIGK